MVNIGKKDLSSTAAFVNAVSEGYYPRGEIVVKGTSSSQEGVSNRTLNSRTLSDVMMGDALFRNAKYSIAFNNKAVNSSLNSLITGGAQTAYANYDSLEVNDPNSIDYEISEDGEVKPTVLKGGTGLNAIIANMIVGKKAGESFGNKALNQIYASQSSMSTQSGLSDDSMHEPAINESANASAVSGGSRQAAVATALVPGELDWILERGKILKDAVPKILESSDVLANGYNFDIPDSYTGFIYADGSSTFPGLTGNTRDVDTALVKAKSQKIYISPALIECLIYLNSKIHFYGGFGIDRKPYVSSKTISNHTVGRAFDIHIIGNKNGTNYDIRNNSGNLTIYRNAVTLLLQAIDAMPEHLKPDMVVMAAGLAQEFNIVMGRESADAEIYKKYPGCRNINFAANPGHNNHIHISFSSARSGIYSGPGGAFAIQPVGNLPGNTQYQTAGTEERRLINQDKGLFDVKFTTNYTGNTSAVLSKQDIFNLLNSTVCGPEAAAFLSVIASREGTVYSINPNLGTSDFSLGMFQVSMLAIAHGKKLFTIFSGSQAVQTEGWKIATKDWQQKGLTNIDTWYNYIKKQYDSAGGNTSTYKARMISEVDTRVWVPLVQAYMVYTVVRSVPAPHPFPPSLKLGIDPFSGGNIFFAWGDYGGGPVPGVIYRIKYSDVANVYTSSGRSEAKLRQWFLNFYSAKDAGAPSRSAPLIVSWLSGAYFGSRNSTVPT